MKHLIAISMIGAAGAAIGNVPIYQNDFTTRTSDGTIPELGVWHVAQPYLNAKGKVEQRQIVSYNNPDSEVALRQHGYGFDLYGKHRYVYFSDFFNGELSSSGHASFDGWFHPNWRTGTASSTTSGYSNLWMHKAGINASDGANPTDPNPCFWFYYDTSTKRQGYVLQSLYNTFTNGQLKIQVDMRAPLCWNMDSGSGDSVVRHFMIFPVYEKFMHAEVWNGELHSGEVSPGKFGLRCGGSTSYNYRTYPQYYDIRELNGNTTVCQLGNNYSGSGETEGNCYWFRYEVTYDLDKGRFGGSVKSLDADWITGLHSNATKVAQFLALPRPTFDTGVSSLKSNSFSNKYWIGAETNAAGTVTNLANIWQEKGGISGLGIFLGRLNTTSAINLLGGSGEKQKNHVLVDNIRISWKAPSSANFDICYENDFKTRRYRTLSAPTSTTGTYVAKAEVKAERDTFVGYEPTSNIGNNNMVPTIKDDEAEAGEAGVDGWRRHYFRNGNSKSGPVGILSSTSEAPGEGGNIMAFGWNGSYTLISQDIGTSITSGKVTLQADIFLPGEWTEYTYTADANRAMFILGSKAMHTASTSAYPGCFAASFGYRKLRSGSSGSYTYAWQPITGAYGNATVLTGGTEPEKNNWYRYIVTADLDVQTYDVTVNKMGANSIYSATNAVPADSLVFSATGLAFDNDVTDIGSFAIYGYGYGNAVSATAKGHRVLVDNIKITQGATVLYSNDFTTRVRNQAVTRATGYLAYEYNHDDGPDGWIRQDGLSEAAAYAVATVRDDAGNKFVSLGQERECGETTRYGHSLGQLLKQKDFIFSVDIRPPLHFVRAVGEASVTVGGRSLEQLQTLGFDDDKLLTFGFKCTNTVATLPESLIDPGVLFIGEETPEVTVDNTHWYRFKVSSDVQNGTLGVKVYDLGTAHPTVSTTVDEPIAEVSGIEPNTPLANGLSAFYLTAKQVGHTFGETGVDPLQMLVDNIVTEKVPKGLVIVVR